MKIEIRLDRALLRIVDLWVREGRFSSRDQAIQAAIMEMCNPRRQHRLARELDRLDVREERECAGERLAGETWDDL